MFIDLNIKSLTNSAREKINEQILGEVKEYVAQTVFPYLNNCLSAISSGDRCTLEISSSGEQIFLLYNSLFDLRTSHGSYIKNRVMIEFVGRNLILPNNNHEIIPYISTPLEIQGISDVKFPKVEVVVLSPERTFWEKATLLHAECKKGIRVSAERLSRHWFDLVALWNHEIGQQAVQNRELLDDVVKHKHCFYYTGSAKYHECSDYGFVLIPNTDDLQKLRQDYDAMKESGMIPSTAILFDDMMHTILDIQTYLNTRPKNQTLVMEAKNQTLVVECSAD